MLASRSSARRTSSSSRAWLRISANAADTSCGVQDAAQERLKVRLHAALSAGSATRRSALRAKPRIARWKGRPALRSSRVVARLLKRKKALAAGASAAPAMSSTQCSSASRTTLDSVASRVEERCRSATAMGCKTGSSRKARHMSRKMCATPSITSRSRSSGVAVMSATLSASACGAFMALLSFSTTNIDATKAT
eukprot:scaffold517_cov255-Pinguiococcus_pyrenoidosus.AAC.15